MMMKKTLVRTGLILFLALGWLGFNSIARADDCENKSVDDKVSCYESKLKETQGKQKTLSSTISYLDNQIAFKTAEIEKTEADLKNLEKEIATLSIKIERLDLDLNDVSKSLLSRIGASYKRSYIKPMYLFFSSKGFNDFFVRNKYLKVIQLHDRKKLIELQQTKDSHEKKKNEKKNKQEEAANLKQRLSIKKINLGEQKQEKQRLLEVTNNDEIRYQALLAEAKAQKAAFNSYVSSQGGASILSNQTKCDGWGCYYNQRDSAWGNLIIGSSGDSTMKEYGCLVTAMAMIGNHYGKNLTPAQIAGSSNPFFGSTAYMLLGTWSVNGVTMTRTRLGSSLTNIDNELNAGRPVIVGIYAGPDHFVVIKGKENGQYIMHDPFVANGGNLKFTDKYPLSAISQVDKVSVN